jgi:oligopeptidase B
METSAPPVAKRIPFQRTYHGDTVVDHYAWLADQDDPDTLAYLAGENAYTRASTAHLGPLEERIFAEIKARTAEDDLTVPIRRGAYWYYVRMVEGEQYGIHCRRVARPGDTDPPDPGTGAPPADEQVLLDGNRLAGGHEFFALGSVEVSPDGRRLAYAVDTVGGERYVLRVKDLRTGHVLPDEIPDTFTGMAWSTDATALFYVTLDHAWRPYRVWRHRIGSPAHQDELLYEETDERFRLSVSLSRSQRYVRIDSRSPTTAEVRLRPADGREAPLVVVAPRRQGVLYQVEHDATGNRLLILHNDGAEDFALATTPADAPGEWQPLIEHVPGVRLSGVDAFAGHVVVSLRSAGLTGLRVLPLATGAEPYEVDFPEPLYRVALEPNPEYATGSLRLRYTSMVTPPSVYDYYFERRELVLRKATPVLGGYDPAGYEQFREWAVAEDGTRVPISLVCRRGVARDGSAPCVLSGYGAYEMSTDPWFSTPRLSLLDRGVVFAIAHVRGGGELGRRWYEDGKLLAKRNTFTDFVACGRQLVGAAWTSPDRLVARGTSAGGLLAGAVANLAPRDFAGIQAQVPFVDPLNSMLDPSLPLTVTEWEEWGNPLESAEAYHYLKSYSPYENVVDQPYPAILAVTSLRDVRVHYHEPAKWIAELRAVAPGGSYLLRTDMSAGHSGPGGRYDAWREQAFMLAWILDRLGFAA